MFDQVSCVIPGASHYSQIENNALISIKENLTKEQMEKVKIIYDRYIREDVHNLW